MESLIKITEKRDVLVAERDQYNHEAEDREIERKEIELNQLVRKRNDKKSLYDSITKEIDRYNTLEQGIINLYPEDENDESHIEHPIEI